MTCPHSGFNFQNLRTNEIDMHPIPLYWWAGTVSYLRGCVITTHNKVARIQPPLFNPLNGVLLTAHKIKQIFYKIL